jgi:hypothetical protein
MPKTLPGHGSTGQTGVNFPGNTEQVSHLWIFLHRQSIATVAIIQGEWKAAATQEHFSQASCPLVATHFLSASVCELQSIPLRQYALSE